MANVDFASLDPEQLLFATDVLKHVLRLHNLDLLLKDFVKTHASRTAESYRSGEENHFDVDISKIVDEIDERQYPIVLGDFSEIENKSLVSFENYIRSFKDSKLPKVLDAGGYLVLCAHVCLMACLYGTVDALEVGIERIVSFFPTNEDGGKLIWKGMSNLSKKYKKGMLGNLIPAIYNRETVDILSGTDESSNASSTNTESDSTSENQNATSASSEESLNELIMKLNASSVECPTVKSKGNATSASTTEFANVIDDKASSAAITPVCTITFDTSKSLITIRSAEGVGEIASKSALASSIDCLKVDENKENTSETLSTKCISESTACATEKVEEAVQNPSVSSSTSKMPVVNFDFEGKFQAEFSKSPSKSLLGKRPSPRKEISLRGATDDSETEIKKPKLTFPESDDEYE